MAAIWWRLLISIPLYTNTIIYAMEVIEYLFRGFPELWGGGVAHSVMILSLVITIGLSLGKLKVRGVSLGLAWILFAGLLFGHFQFNLDEHLLHFLKEFGLILFVYSIGLSRTWFLFFFQTRQQYAYWVGDNSDSHELGYRHFHLLHIGYTDYHYRRNFVGCCNEYAWLGYCATGLQ